MVMLVSYKLCKSSGNDYSSWSFALQCDAINQAACDILKEVADADVYICGGMYL